MSDEQPTTIGPWVNGAVAAGLAVAAAAWLVWASPEAIGASTVAHAVLMWLWWLAAVLAVEWAVLRMARRPPPAWPFVRRPVAGSAAGAFALLVVAVLLMREGVLGPGAALDLGWYHGERDTEVDARLQTDVGPAGLPLPPTLKGAYLACDVACEPGGPVCASFERWLVCDDERGDRPAGAERAEVEIEVRRMDAPGCWMPLYKRGHVEPSVRITIHEKQGDQDRTQRMRIDATVDQTLTGLASCRMLHERIGHAVADIVATRLQKVVEG